MRSRELDQEHGLQPFKDFILGAVMPVMGLADMVRLTF